MLSNPWGWVIKDPLFHWISHGFVYEFYVYLSIRFIYGWQIFSLFCYLSSKYIYIFKRRVCVCVCLWVKVKATHSCPTLSDPIDYTVHGIPQVRILEWVAFSFSRESSQPRNQTQVYRIVAGFPISWATRDAQSPQITTQIRDANHDQWQTYCFFQSLSWICRLILCLSTEV